MMLADHIRDARGSVYDVGDMCTNLGAVIERAQRFQISDDTGEACYELTRSKPSNLIKALSLCRLPYPAMWIEMRGGLGRGKSDTDQEATVMPLVQGALIEELGEQRGVITFAWRYKTPPEEFDQAPELGEYGVNCSPFGFYFDWRGEADIASVVCASHARILASVDKSDRTSERFLRLIIGNCEPHWLRDDRPGELAELMREKGSWKSFASDLREVEAVHEHNRHMRPGLSPHGVGSMLEHARILPHKIGMYLTSWEKDIYGEGMFVEFMLAMLNSRNCVGREPVSMNKLNKARAKRGKGPLLDFTRLSITMPAARQRVADAMGMTREAARYHLVRGHFKIRKTGVYWWNAFPRGDKSNQVQRTRYVVV